MTHSNAPDALVDSAESLRAEPLALIDSTGRLIALGGDWTPLAALTQATPARAVPLVAAAPMVGDDFLRALSAWFPPSGGGPDWERLAPSLDELSRGTRERLVVPLGAPAGDAPTGGEPLELHIDPLAGHAHDASRHRAGLPSDTRPVPSEGDASRLLLARMVRRMPECATQAVDPSEAAKQEFLDNVSHELRTPLNAILGFSRQLLKDPLTPEQTSKLQFVYEAGRSLLELVNNILDMSKLARGQLELSSTPFDLPLLLTESLDMARPLAGYKHLELRCQIDPRLPQWLWGDRTRLRHVLMNLLGNAVKFTDTGHVELRAQLVALAPERATLRIEVSDTGIGIPPGRQSRIFDIFTQGDGSSTRRYGGTGLGLAICRRLTERMGGQIGVDSVPGQGSTFWFTVVFRAQALPSEFQPGPSLVARGHVSAEAPVEPRGISGLPATSAVPAASAVAAMPAAPAVSDTATQAATRLVCGAVAIVEGLAEAARNREFDQLDRLAALLLAEPEPRAVGDLAFRLQLAARRQSATDVEAIVRRLQDTLKTPLPVNA